MHDRYVQSQLLEAQVLEIVERVRAGAQVEDDLIELKWKVPDAIHKTARQIGGLANAAGGLPFLWIVGVNEKTGELNPKPFRGDIANWWAAVQKWFSDDVSPHLAWFRQVVVESGRSVSAFQFTTEDAPYLVQTEGGGQVEAEVPWREGTSTHTARRHQLLRSVVAKAMLPDLEPIDGEVSIDPGNAQLGLGYSRGALVHVHLQVFVSAADSNVQSVLPAHRQQWTLTFDDQPDAIELSNVRVTGPMRTLSKAASPSGQSGTVHAGYIDVLDSSTMVIAGSAAVRLYGYAEVSEAVADSLMNASQVSCQAVLPMDRSNCDATLAVKFRPLTSSELAEQVGSVKFQRATFRFLAG
jgi:hypothetical protein